MKRFFLIFFLALLVVVVIGAVVVDSKYAVLWPSPRISPDTLVKPATRGQLMLNVPLARGLIERQFLKGSKIPAWVVPLALPHAAALIFTTDFALSELDATVFLNDQRLGPLIRDWVNAQPLPKPADEWFHEKMALKKRGLLIREGVTRIDRGLVGKIRGLWKNAPVSEPLRLEGTHLVEAVLDNRDGGAMAIVGSLAASQGVDVQQYLDDRVLGFLTAIGSLRLYGDLTPDNVLKIHLEIAGSPSADPQMLGLLDMVLKMQFPEVKEKLQILQIKIDGNSTVEGNMVKGDYTVPGFDRVFGLLVNLARF